MATIVIVEDDEYIREELALLLTSAGYEASYLSLHMRRGIFWSEIRIWC